MDKEKLTWEQKSHIDAQMDKWVKRVMDNSEKEKKK